MKHYSLKEEVLDKNINNYYEYLSPNYVFIKCNPNTKILKEKNKYLYKEELALEGTFNIYSNISGYVKGIKKFNNFLNIKNDYLIIENDYKEKYLSKKNINKEFQSYKKIDIINKLKKYNHGLFKDILDFLENHEIIENIVVIGFDDCLYNYQANYYLSNDITHVFDAIELLSYILDCNEAHLLIKSNSIDAIHEILDFEGTYPNTKVNYLPDIYPLKSEHVLKHYCSNYVTNNSLVIDLEKIIFLYDLIYRDKYLTEKIITITNLPERKVYYCKTKLNVLLKNLLKNINDDEVCYINNPLNANIVDINETIIDWEVSAIIIDKKSTILVDECINCGKCIEVCPLNLKELTSNPLCIKCNLCSYMCPSNRNLLEGVNHE